MAKDRKTTIGVKGVTATTHCIITGAPLINTPTNYDLGSNYYVSVNPGRKLTPAHVRQISAEILPHFSEEIEEIEEIEEDNNDN